MLNLQLDGYGVAQGIPTLVMAASSCDDVLAISMFGVFLGIAFSEGIEKIILNLLIEKIILNQTFCKYPFLHGCCCSFCYYSILYVQQNLNAEQ